MIVPLPILCIICLLTSSASLSVRLSVAASAALYGAHCNLKFKLAVTTSIKDFIVEEFKNIVRPCNCCWWWWILFCFLLLLWRTGLPPAAAESGTPGRGQGTELPCLLGTGGWNQHGRTICLFAWLLVLSTGAYYCCTGVSLISLVQYMIHCTPPTS